MRSRNTKTSAWADALRIAAAFLAGLVLVGSAGAQTSDRVSDNAFRVCADPANTPMSSRDGSGFENRLTELFTDELGRPVQYT